ncbi:MAG TPA: D-aminoacyl-tRNA deacylase [Methylomirabilota bacterium]|nr:D-aminoacyl-tRNA deacylase [Methylomirabilota bacterium]
MRVVLQRVTLASLVINGAEHAKIGPGVVVLVGIEPADGAEDLAWVSGKLVRLRIFDDADGVMNLSVSDTQGELLVVSQFTLHASTVKGNRPSYTRAARPEVAQPLYASFLKQIETDLGRPVASGVFGADMKITLTNDGPVTILLNSKQRE